MHPGLPSCLWPSKRRSSRALLGTATTAGATTLRRRPVVSGFPGVLAMPNLAVGVFGILVLRGVYHSYFDVFECEQVVLGTNVTSRECREFET